MKRKRLQRVRRPSPLVWLSTLSPLATRGWLRAGDLLLPCAVGRNGCRALKREGDGATPFGVWRMRAVFFRPDRMRRPRSGLSISPLRRGDGWCDAPDDRNYNRRVHLPYAASAEQLWRNDALYDVVVVLGYNDRPRLRGRGSAIFLHVAQPDYAPTGGCIAVSRPHLLRLLQMMGPRAAVRIGRRHDKKRPERQLRAS